MKIELITIFKWLSVNRLSLNSEKTVFLMFDSLDMSHEINVECNLRSITIKECKETKYLGLILDNKLNFKSHVDHVIKKVTKRIGAMYRSKSLLPTKYRKMFANALMLPQFDYLDTIYCRANKTKLAELDIIYKKVAKIALDVPQTESSLNVYKEMKWLPLHLRRQLHLSGRWQAPAAVLPPEGPKDKRHGHSRARRAREWPKHASPRARRARGRAKLSAHFGACQCYYMFFTIQPKIAIFMAQFKYLNDGQNA